jgi:hypothetical protein
MFNLLYKTCGIMSSRIFLRIITTTVTITVIAVLLSLAACSITTIRGAVLDASVVRLAAVKIVRLPERRLVRALVRRVRVHAKPLVKRLLVVDAKFTPVAVHEEVGHKNWNPDKVVL